jgi:hypothetical protein
MPSGLQHPLDGAIVAAYLVCGWMCWRTAKVVSRANARPAPGFWHVTSALCLTLAAFKAFAIQQLAGGWIRQVLRAQGWYAGRRPVQAAAIYIVVSLTVLGMLWLTRGRRRQRLHETDSNLVGLIAVLLLASFVLIRGISLHYVDEVLYRLPGLGALMNVAIELLLIGVLAVVAWRTARIRSVSGARRVTGRVR